MPLRGEMLNDGVGVFCNVQIPPGCASTTASFVPSAEVATPCQKPVPLFEVHDTPELVESQIQYGSTSARVAPSADDATAVVRETDALLVIQVEPESVEVKI
jgi:hypothetical protein